MSSEFPIPLLMAVEGLLMTPTRVIVAASGSGGGVPGTWTDNFRVVTYQGTSDTQTVSIGFNVGLSITRRRDLSGQFVVVDSLRGPTKTLYHSTTAEVSENSVINFTSAGIVLGKENNANASDGAYVTWCWKADASASHASHDGEHFNKSSGLSIVNYTGTGAVKSINHTLGEAPKMMLVKKRSGAGSWYVYHADMAADPETDYILLDKTSPFTDDNTVWNDTAPTNEVFTVGTHIGVNSTGADYEAILFKDVSGFSAFGFYTGNANSIGPVVSTPFAPGMLMLKRISSTGEWNQYDTRRDIYNQRRANLKPNRENPEGFDAANHNVDLNSGSFQLRGTDSDINQNSGRFLYAAFKDTWTPEERTSGTFKTVTYSGTGASANISLGFQPGMLWIKARTSDAYPVLVDAIRGPTQVYHPGRSDAQISSTSAVAAFLSTGFALTGGYRVNNAGDDYVAWAWKADTVSPPHAGRNAEQYNQASGFSVVQYTGINGITKIPHSLATAPAFIFGRYSDASNWEGFHKGIQPPSPEDWTTKLNSDANATDDANVWADTYPEAYAFTVGQNMNQNAKEFTSYLFADVPGFMKLGEYSGSGAGEGPTLSCDFSVGYFLVKAIDTTAAQDWLIYDNVRNPTNPRTKALHLPLENSENHYTDLSVEFSSTWVQIKSTDAALNQANREYLYMAIKG